MGRQLNEEPTPTSPPPFPVLLSVPACSRVLTNLPPMPAHRSLCLNGLLIHLLESNTSLRASLKLSIFQKISQPLQNFLSLYYLASLTSK